MKLEYGDYSLELISIEEARTHVANGLVCYDFTKLTAINTCPTFGVLRYALHRTESSSTRSMAIDAGKGAASIGGPFAGVLGAIATASSYAGSLAMITSNVVRAKNPMILIQ